MGDNDTSASHLKEQSKSISPAFYVYFHGSGEPEENVAGGPKGSKPVETFDLVVDGSSSPPASS
jgi:hypothetical protein